MSGVAARAIGWTESGLVPDTVIRGGMRRLLERKLAKIRDGETLETIVAEVNNTPLGEQDTYVLPASDNIGKGPTCRDRRWPALFC